MANIQNLIPQNKRTKEEQRKIARKGGLSRSPKKSDAARLRRMKERLALGTGDVKEIIEFVNDRKSAALQIHSFIHRQLLDAPSMSKSERVQIARLELECFKVIHGDKKIVQSTNLSVSVVMSDEEAWRIIEGLRVKCSGEGKV